MNIILINSNEDNPEIVKAKNVVVDTFLSTLKAVMYSHNNYALKEFARNIFKWNGQYDDKGKALLEALFYAGYNYDNYFWIKLNLQRVFSYYQGCINLVIPDWCKDTDVQYLLMQDYVDKVYTVHISNEGLPSADLHSNFTMRSGDEQFMVEQTLKLLDIMNIK